jgi:exonuclease SbcC
MKLKSIKLENWKKHTHKTIVFDNNATIIYGPNETGKSTLFEGLYRGFFDKHNSTSLEIKKLEPFTSLGGICSKVSIDFWISQDEYVIEKQFNNSTSSKLFQAKNGKYTLLSEGDIADRRLIELLKADVQSRGATDPSKWGAFYWLWTLQENRELPRDADTSSLFDTTLTTSQVLVTPKFQLLSEKVNQEFTKYFSPTGRDKKGSPYLEAINNFQEIENERGALELLVQTYENHQRQISEKEAELPDLEKSLTASKSEYQQTLKESQKYIKIGADIKSSESKINEIKSKIKEISSIMEQLTSNSNKIKTVREEEKELSDKLIKIESTYQILETKIDDINSSIENSTETLAEIDDLVADARVLWTTSKAKLNLEAVNNKINRIVEIETKIEQLQNGKKSIVVDEHDLHVLQKDALKLESLRARLKESGLQVDRNPGKKGQLSVLIDGAILDPEISSASAVEEIKIFNDLFGDVTIKASIQKAHDTRQDINVIENKIQSALKTSGVSTLDELSTQFLENQKIVIEIEKLSAERRGIDNRSKTELEAEKTSYDNDIIRYKEKERSANAIKKNLIDVNLGDLVNKRELERKDADKNLIEIRQKRDRLKEDQDKKREEKATVKANYENNKKQINILLDEQQNLIKKYGSQELQEKELTSVTDNLNKEESNKKELENQYKIYEDGLQATIMRLENSISNKENIIKTRQKSIDELYGQIKEPRLEGAYSRLSNLESKLGRARLNLDAETLKASSVKLLKKIIDDNYALALKSVSSPIKGDVEKYLSYITGNLHDQVELDDNLFPVRLGEKAVREIKLDYEDASSGLKETLNLCIRLAIAKQLSTNDSQCVILDDPFIHVSPDRSRRTIEVINEAMEKQGLQIVVFTFREMELSGFKGSFVDIQK